MENFDFLYGLREYTRADVSEGVFDKLNQAQRVVTREFADIVNGLWLISQDTPPALLVSLKVPQSDTRALELDAELGKIFDDDDGEPFMLFDLQKDVIERGEISKGELTDVLVVYTRING